MKKIIFTILMAGLAVASHGQKVDLDKFFFDVAYQKLPAEPVFMEQRTYPLCG